MQELIASRILGGENFGGRSQIRDNVLATCGGSTQEG